MHTDTTLPFPYLPRADREMIENKYHKMGEEFDPFNRMAYHGYDYDETTGVSDEEIDRGLAALAEELKQIEKKGIYLVGDGYDVAKKQLLSAGVTLLCTPRGLRAQSGASCAAVARRMMDEGRTATDREIAPSYLRLPQAERERLEKENAGR